MGLAQTKKCPFCECTIQSIDHTLDFCKHPELDKAREWVEGDPLNINSIAPDIFPELLRLGIQRALDKTISGTYWGTPLEDFSVNTHLDRKAIGIMDH